MLCFRTDDDSEGQPPAPKKAAVDSALEMMHETVCEFNTFAEASAVPKPHGMGVTVRVGANSQMESENAHTVLKTSRHPSTYLVSEVPEARAVVVLHAHFKSGEVRRSHGFCIDSKQGILVGGAHTLPLKLQDLDLIEVHLYNSKENRFEQCFVAELLPGGISSIFQRGGMDLALLCITHHYDSKATDKRGTPITDVTDIQKSLSALPIGSAGYEPRDQVSVIRFPIIKADNSRGCKPKCGRVIASVDSCLHIDFTELQDGDSGSVVVNGAGEAIAFLMGRPPNRDFEASACLGSSCGSKTMSSPNNSVYYARLLGVEESQAFIQNFLLWNKLNLDLSTNAPVPWGEYKIKQRISKLEQVRGLTMTQREQVGEFVSDINQILADRRRAESQEEQARILEEMRVKSYEAIVRLEAAKRAAEVQNKTNRRIQDEEEVKHPQIKGYTIQDTLAATEECKASDFDDSIEKQPDCNVYRKLCTRQNKVANDKKKDTYFQANSIHKMQVLVDQMQAGRHEQREEHQTNETALPRLEMHALNEEVPVLETSDKVSSEVERNMEGTCEVLETDIFHLNQPSAAATASATSQVHANVILPQIVS